MFGSPLLALFLGLVPGLGHLAVRRAVRAFMYPFLIFVLLAFAFFFAVDGNPDSEWIALMLLIIAGAIWLINFFDLAVYLVRKGHNAGLPKGHAHSDGAAGFPGFGGMRPYPQGPYGQGGMAAGPPPLSGFAAGREDADPSRYGTEEGGSVSAGFGGDGGGYGRDKSGPQTGYGGGSHMGGYGGHNGGGKGEIPQAGYGGRNEAGERFYTILLSFVPGLGHLQLGLMQRGLTLMTGFFGLLAMIVFVAILTQEDGFLIFLFALPVVWLYGMFDAIRHVQQKQIGVPLVDRSILDDWDDHRQAGRRSRWFATVLSVLPGAGHMYLGLQKRGLQLMAGFLLSIYLLDLLQLSLFLFIVPLFWCFAFFDALQLQSRYREAGVLPEDIPLVEWLVYRRRWIGLALLAIGLYYMADRLLFDVLDRLLRDYRVSGELRYYFKTGLTALLLVGAGVKLMAGGRAADRLRGD